MRSVFIRGLLVALVIGAGVAVLSRTADAATILAEISVAGRADVGHPANLQVTLRSVDRGLPVANATVTAYTDASFGGVTGEVKLGTAVTDENGIALMSFEPRSSGEHQIRVEYLAPGEAQPEVATTTISVAGASQLHRSAAGIQVPGLNVWLIITLVALVWFILFSVGLRVVAIARAGTDAELILERAVRSREVEPQVTAPETRRSEA